jgi:integrase
VIGHDDVSREVDKLVKTPGEAMHAFTAIRTFFRWCVLRYLPHAPTDRMKPLAKYVPRKRVLTDNELVAVWRAVDGYPFGTIVRLPILTGRRCSEIASLRWSFIDVEKKRSRCRKRGTAGCMRSRSAIWLRRSWTAFFGSPRRRSFSLDAIVRSFGMARENRIGCSTKRCRYRRGCCTVSVARSRSTSPPSKFRRMSPSAYSIIPREQSQA